MKILLVGNYLSDRQESMQRFVDVMERELLLAGHEVRKIRPEAKLMKWSWPNKLKKWIGYIDKYILFPPVLRSATAWADVVHICDHSNAMYVKHVAFRPHMITCHDLLAVRSARGEFPVNPVGLTGKLLQTWIANGLKSATHIVCDSNATRNDCIHVLGIDSNRLDVVYLGLNYRYRRMPYSEANEHLSKLGIPSATHFLMNISSNSWYKNRSSVLKIFSRLVTHHHCNLYLAMAGEYLTPEMMEIVRDANIENRVLQLGKVSNEVLCALYSRADGLIFPSFEEGFGWPVLEAQASGCPVFTSNRAPMTEVGGDAAVYLDPNDPERSADIINRHLPISKEMSDKGLLNAQNFSNSKMTDSYLNIYAQIVQRVPSK